MKKYIHYYIIVMAVTMLSPIVLLSQPVRNPSTGGTNGEPDAAPIDGGISLLVAAGIGYGAKKLRAKKDFERKESGLIL